MTFCGFRLLIFLFINYVGIELLQVLQWIMEKMKIYSPINPHHPFVKRRCKPIAVRALLILQAPGRIRGVTPFHHVKVRKGENVPAQGHQARLSSWKNTE
jgi:hypothetical protein